jgi:hypothetical protein
MTRIVTMAIPVLFAFCNFLEAADVSQYRAKVRACLDTLIEHGQDSYGEKATPILVSILDVNTLECPREPKTHDEAWRVIRRHRRNPAGADLATDMQTLSAMKRLGGRYERFAGDYINYYMTHFLSAKQKLVCWGWHEYYDVFTDKCVFDQHELHAGLDTIDWPLLWEVNPNALERQAEQTWQWHVIDKKTGEINRHGDGQRGCDFTMSAGSYIELFSFMFKATHEAQWLDRAQLIANYYWGTRHRTSNLIAERPNAGSDRFDGAHFVTATTGPYCLGLLYAYEQTADPLFKTHALAYLKAYAHYGYDSQTKRYWGSLKLDGTPNTAPVTLEDYGKYEPRGYLDLWKPYVAGYQHALYTAEAYLKAYKVSKDPDMLTQAERFARWIVDEPPGKGGIQDGRWYSDYTAQWAAKGTYAGHYGRAISVLIGMHKSTGEQSWLEPAQTLADEAIEKLYRNGLFLGHPGKDYYEAVDGVGYLLNALLNLDQALALAGSV